MTTQPNSDVKKGVKFNAEKGRYVIVHLCSNHHSNYWNHYWDDIKKYYICP